MIPAAQFWDVLKSRDLTFFSGVPCSILEHIIHHAIQDPRIAYVPAPREDAALGLASGAKMCGRGSGILMQNSGLGNVVNTLTSFNLMYKVPVLMVISWRGYQQKDAPEHLVMGEKTLGLLQYLDIPYRVLEESDLDKSVDAVLSAMLKNQVPAAIILRKGIVE